MFRRSTLAAALALAVLTTAAVAQAQRGGFDSGWRQVSAAALRDLELEGAGVRVNNLVVSPEGSRGYGSMVGHSFKASGLKRTPGKRWARIELVRLAADNQPTIVSVVVLNFVNEAANAVDNGTHRFAAIPGEVAGTKDYWVRLVVQ